MKQEQVSLKDEGVKKPPTTPWKPAPMLTVRGKDPNYRYRWVRKDLLDKRLEEGWEPIVNTSDPRVQAPETTIVDGTPMSTYVTKRGLILCRMPEERAVARSKYYRDMTDGSLTTVVDELKEKVGVDPNTGKSLSFGNITIGRSQGD